MQWASKVRSRLAASCLVLGNRERSWMFGHTTRPDPAGLADWDSRWEPAQAHCNVHDRRRCLGRCICNEVGPQEAGGRGGWPRLAP